MAKYGNFVYGGAKYGVTPKLAYSVEPMSVIVINFNEAYIFWYSPTGNFSRIRLVRNQVGIPEHAEDGVIIWDEFATEGNVSRESFKDGEDNPDSVPLISGRTAYYAMFLFTEANVWVKAGHIEETIPSDHGMQKKIMDIIPKVYTSKEQSPLAVTDQTSSLYRFIEGMSFTFEQFLTFIDLVRPNHSKEGSPSSLIPIQVDHVGLDPEPNLSTKSQKQLIREAFFMYSNKGLKTGIETYVESLTDYAPTVTVSPNLLLTVQDSTFYNSTGNWVFENCTATVSDEQVPNITDNVIDGVYSCKVIATDGFSMLLGANNTVTRAVPVTAGEEYIASCKIKSPTSAGSVMVVIGWYDGSGTLISASSGTLVAANNTWKSVSTTDVAPSKAVYAGLQISSDDSGTYYLDQVCMQLGDTINYDEARAITVELKPNKINYIKNPSFEVNSSTWSVTSAPFTRDSAVPTQGYSGSYSGKFTVTGSGDIETDYQIPITAGQYYNFSFYALSYNALSLEGRILFYDAEDNLLDEFNSTFDITTEFSRASMTALTDSTSTVSYAKVQIFFPQTGVYYIDLVQFEKAANATEYFDGSMPSEYGVVWDGTDHEAYSYQYYNKLFKIPRLANTLSDWTPPNSFWRIKTPINVEYTNLTV